MTDAGDSAKLVSELRGWAFYEKSHDEIISERGKILNQAANWIEQHAQPATRERGEAELNLNENVRVKLTEKGLGILRKKHAEMSASFKTAFGEFDPPKNDSDGYVKYQLWSLISDFGEFIYMGCTPPFETTILVPVKSTPAQHPAQRAEKIMEDERYPQLDPDIEHDKKTVVEALCLAERTICNDDYSRPGTIERVRHCQRICALWAARDYILRTAEAACALTAQPAGDGKVVTIKQVMAAYDELARYPYSQKAFSTALEAALKAGETK